MTPVWRHRTDTGSPRIPATLVLLGNPAVWRLIDYQTALWLKAIVTRIEPQARVIVTDYLRSR